jgi:hypothetical protein
VLACGLAGGSASASRGPLVDIGEIRHALAASSLPTKRTPGLLLSWKLQGGGGAASVLLALPPVRPLGYLGHRRGSDWGIVVLRSPTDARAFVRQRHRYAVETRRGNVVIAYPRSHRPRNLDRIRSALDGLGLPKS